ncbi:MAG TPA: VOC family protein [Pseudogracilibacillus sp.]|nr:VOC family protein [Pseudogracilibacillus sp.]
MTIKLDHVVIYAHDHNKSAKQFANVMNLSLGRMTGSDYDFTIVRINHELALYFMDRENINLQQHFAFTVNGKDFDNILKQLKKKNIAFGNSPYHTTNESTDHDFAPRGLFWTNLDECLFEVMTGDF